MKIEVDQLDLDELRELGVKSWPVMEYEEEKFEEKNILKDEVIFNLSKFEQLLLFH